MKYNVYGYPGPKGDSAYDVWLKAGNSGSLADFLNSLKGGGGTSFSTASITGSNIHGSINAIGFSLSVPNYLTTAAQGAGGGEWSVSTKTGSDIQISTGNTNTLYYGGFLTTAAQSNHTHSQYQTAGNYLTTAMQSNAGSNYVGLSSTGITGGSGTINSSQLLLNIPNGSLYYSDGSGITWGSTTNGISTTITGSVQTNYLTTAAQSDHTHSQYINTSKEGNYFQTSASSLLQIAGAYLTTAAQSGHTHGSGPSITGGISVTSNSTAWSVAVGAYITTAMASGDGSKFINTGGSTTASTTGSDLKIIMTSAGLNFGVPKWLTTAVQSSQTLQLTLGGNSTSAGGGYAVMSTGTIFIAGGNNITLSQNANSFTISGANAGGAQTAVSGIGASDSTYTSGTVIFSGQNNVTVGTSVNGASQYVRLSVGNYITTGMASDAGSNFIGIANSTAYQTSVLSGTFQQISASSAYQTATLSTALMPLSYSSGFQTATLSTKFLTTAAQSNQVINSINGNTGIFSFATGSSLSSSINGNSITWGLASNITTALQSQGAYLTTAALSQNTSNYAGISTGSQSTAGSDIVFTHNTAGLNLGVPKYLTTAQAPGAYLTTAMISDNTSVFQYTSANTKFAGTGTTANNATITLNSNGLNISVAAPGGGGVAASIGGNSTSAGGGYSNITSGTMVIMGGNNITLSQNANSITISGANVGGAQTGISGIGVSNTTYTSGTVIYSADNNITIGSSVNGASQYVKFSVGNYITTADLSQNSSLYYYTSASSLLMPIGNSTAYQTGTLANTFAQTANVMLTGERNNYFYTSNNTFLPSANSTQWATGTLSTALMPLAYSSGFQTATLSNTFQQISASSAYQTATLSTALMPLGYSSKFATGTLSTDLMALSYSSAFQTATLATKFLTTAALSGDTTKYLQAWELEGNNTAGTTVSTQGTKLYLSGGNNITLSGNSNTIIISAGVGGGGGIAASIAGNSTSAAGGYSNITSGTMLLAGGSNITLSQAGSVISIVGATANGPASLVFNDGSGVSWGSAVNGSTTSITASIQQGRISFYENMPFLPVTQTMTVNSRSWVVFPFIIPQDVQFNYIRFLLSQNVPASTTAVTTANTSLTASQGRSLYYVIYSQGQGASSNSLQYVSSTSAGITNSFSCTFNANGSEYTNSIWQTFPGVSGTAINKSTALLITSATHKISYDYSSALTGPKVMDIPFSGSLSEGNYWMAIGESSTSNTNVAAATRLLSINAADSYIVASQPNNAYGPIGIATAVSTIQAHQMGLWTTNAQGTTASIALNAISSSASYNRPYFQLWKQA